MFPAFAPGSRFFGDVLPTLAQAGVEASDWGVGGNSPKGWWTVAAVFAALLIGGFVFRRTTRAGVLAAATAKEAVRQPVFLLSAALAVALLVVNTFLPFFSLGEDVKMLKDTGLATMLIVGLLVAVWTASTTIHDEIEGRTAMTLLSKPINRRQFVLGKYLGILQAVGLLTIVVGGIFLGLVYYKVIYDSRESQEKMDYTEWVQPEQIGVEWVPGLTGKELRIPNREAVLSTFEVVPALMLVFLEIAVLTAISVAISCRLPMVVNLSVCFTVFIIGHLTGVLVLWKGDGGTLVEGVRFIAGLIATVLPALPAYSSEAAIAREALVPPEYLGWAALYTLCYSTAAILVAFLLFEDRDLA
ncbi:ABC-2 transporter permease [Alienimonas californiensis]|uniref:ABC-2 family transporter protein n=1 Tax=Alienimonas californiensis TaxID=2527989 RepID=A0A517P9H0_9PLAN|nr:ABC transporter permease [Alienimonas californiensis]QDT16027.1 ABC-2 family transporter protein [Alienimonas californiensis]